MRRLRGSSPIAPEEASINLTSLIDVVFVVLIIFILIAPMLELDRIQLAQASCKDVSEKIDIKENAPIAIYVHADNSIWFQNRSVTAKVLLDLLKEAKNKHISQPPQLFQDKKAYFETYQMVKNAVESAGFEQLDVILQPG